ncbi:PAS domain S-box protein [Novispirillum sp. DQ9]|uniref:PAS domain S-box protein n=1 Tax=Novispirillum sp. DQ9 TaxID=3398612 RepID=UPI003C7E3751
MDGGPQVDMVLATLLILVFGIAMAGVGATAAYVAARRRARADSAKYQAVVDTAVDPIAVIDQRGIVQSFNRAAESTFGYSAAEVVGRNVSMLMSAPHAANHDGYLRRYLATGEARIIGSGREVEGLRKDGTTFPLELSVGAWRADGHHFFTGIMRDITERKQAELALTRERDRAEAEKARAETERARAEAERDRAARADRAKTNFLAAASHDLRQPVQSLIFQAHALSRRLQGPGTAPILERLNESLDALRALLDGLLDMSRLEAGSVAPQRKALDLGHLINRLGADLRPLAEAKGLALRSVPRRAWTNSDPVLLERMIRNLMENAVRHTRRGKVLLGVRACGEAWRIDVIDTGDGIPPDRVDDIFDEFVQLDSRNREARSGLGLGLAIVQRLAALLDHPVELASRPGHGTRFSVRVPHLEAPAVKATPEAAAAAVAAAGDNGALLVIEDEPLIALGLRDLLESWGHQVAVAGCWAEVVRMAEGGRRPPVAILSDYRLDGGETGADAVRLLRNHFGATIPALIMTGDTAPERLRALHGEGLDVLHKPVTPQALADSLKRLRP